jgi:hypothetical protein
VPSETPSETGAIPSESLSETPTEAPTEAPPTEAPSDEVLTVENSPDLKNLFAKGENDAVSKAFAKTYAGRTIEFDGSIATTSAGLYLVYAGNNSDTECVPGPAFQMRNIQVGGARPTAGDNLHLVAKVGKFNAVQSLFFLDPVSTTRR